SGSEAGRSTPCFLASSSTVVGRTDPSRWRWSSTFGMSSTKRSSWRSIAGESTPVMGATSRAARQAGQSADLRGLPVEPRRFGRGNGSGGEGGEPSDEHGLPEMGGEGAVGWSELAEQGLGVVDEQDERVGGLRADGDAARPGGG